MKTLLYFIRVFFLLCLFLLMTGACAVVPQWQREHLSDPIMLFDEDPEADQMEQHLLPYREGSGGGYGSAGGGCGC